MIEFLTYMVAGVATVACILLIYLVKQIYSPQSPYRED